MKSQPAYKKYSETAIEMVSNIWLDSFLTLLYVLY